MDVIALIAVRLNRDSMLSSRAGVRKEKAPGRLPNKQAPALVAVFECPHFFLFFFSRQTGRYWGQRQLAPQNPRGHDPYGPHSIRKSCNFFRYHDLFVDFGTDQTYNGGLAGLLPSTLLAGICNFPEKLVGNDRRFWPLTTASLLLATRDERLDSWQSRHGRRADRTEPGRIGRGGSHFFPRPPPGRRNSMLPTRASPWTIVCAALP